jgi:hypothetical protein
LEIVILGAPPGVFSGGLAKPTMHSTHNPPLSRLASKIQIAGTIRDDPPVGPELTGLLRVGCKRAPSQGYTQVDWIERRGGERFQHGCGTPMFEHTAIPRQEQGRIVIPGHEDEQWLSCGCNGFEAGRTWGRKTGQKTGSKAAPAH